MRDNEQVAIAWISPGYVDSLFAHSISHLTLKCSGLISDVFSETGHFLSRNRNIVVSKFLEKSKSNWLLMLDSDMFLYPNQFLELKKIADAENKKVVNGLYFVDIGDQIVPVFQKKLTTTIDYYLDYPENSVFEIDSSGLGCCLIHRTVLQDLYDNYKIFFADYPIEGRYMGEDAFFFANVKALGHKVFGTSQVKLNHQKVCSLSESVYKSLKDTEVKLNPYTDWSF